MSSEIDEAMENDTVLIHEPKHTWSQHSGCYITLLYSTIVQYYNSRCNVALLPLCYQLANCGPLTGGREFKMPFLMPLCSLST